MGKETDTCPSPRQSPLSATSFRTKEDGFTLIELLVVVIIIGILAAIAIPVFLGQQTAAQEAAYKSDLATAKVAYVSSQVGTGTLADYGFPSTVEVISPIDADGNFCLEHRTVDWSVTQADAAPAAGACPVG